MQKRGVKVVDERERESANSEGCPLSIYRGETYVVDSLLE